MDPSPLTSKKPNKPIIFQYPVHSTNPELGPLWKNLQYSLPVPNKEGIEKDLALLFFTKPIFLNQPKDSPKLNFFRATFTPPRFHPIVEYHFHKHHITPHQLFDLMEKILVIKDIDGYLSVENFTKLSTLFTTWPSTGMEQQKMHFEEDLWIGIMDFCSDSTLGRLAMSCSRLGRLVSRFFQHKANRLNSIQFPPFVQTNFTAVSDLFYHMVNNDNLDDTLRQYFAGSNPVRMWSEISDLFEFWRTTRPQLHDFFTSLEMQRQNFKDEESISFLILALYQFYYACVVYQDRPSLQEQLSYGLPQLNAILQLLLETKYQYPLKYFFVLYWKRLQLRIPKLQKLDILELASKINFSIFSDGTSLVENLTRKRDQLLKINTHHELFQDFLNHQIDRMNHFLSMVNQKTDELGKMLLPLGGKQVLFLTRMNKIDRKTLEDLDASFTIDFEEENPFFQKYLECLQQIAQNQKQKGRLFFQNPQVKVPRAPPPAPPLNGRGGMPPPPPTQKVSHRNEAPNKNGEVQFPALWNSKRPEGDSPIFVDKMAYASQQSPLIFLYQPNPYVEQLQFMPTLKAMINIGRRKNFQLVKKPVFWGSVTDQLVVKRLELFLKVIPEEEINAQINEDFPPGFFERKTHKYPKTEYDSYDYFQLGKNLHPVSKLFLFNQAVDETLDDLEKLIRLFDLCMTPDMQAFWKTMLFCLNFLDMQREDPLSSISPYCAVQALKRTLSDHRIFYIQHEMATAEERRISLGQYLALLVSRDSKMTSFVREFGNYAKLRDEAQYDRVGFRGFGAMCGPLNRELEKFSAAKEVIHKLDRVNELYRILLEKEDACTNFYGVGCRGYLLVDIGAVMKLIAKELKWTKSLQNFLDGISNDNLPK